MNTQTNAENKGIKMNKKEIIKKGAIKPSVNVLVSCRDKDGRNNALAVAYCGNCSYAPPMVMIGIVPTRFSYHIIKETGCFVVNIPSKENKELYSYMGRVSGADEDKFKTFGVNWSNADIVNAPILDDCPVNIECTVVDSIVTGSHEMFIGRVEKVHAAESVLNKNNMIDEEKLNLL